ncbi:MAG: hypothetical protein ACOYKE_12340 [Ferruginibacter sp.]
MKKIIIGSLVSAIILFSWQSVSWMFLPFHDAGMLQAPAQDSLIQTLSSVLKEEGQYLIPREKIGSSTETQEKFMKDRIGKPWAMITYHTSMVSNMGSAMLRGFLIALACAFLVVLTLSKMQSSGFASIFFSTLSVGIICFLYVWYNNHNWFQTPWSVLKGEGIDLIASWGLTGIWLGWWMGKK